MAAISAAFLRITRTNEVLITAAWALFVCFVHQCFSCLRTALPSPGLFVAVCAHTCTHAKQTEFQVIRDSAVYSVKTVLVISLWRGKTLDRRNFFSYYSSHRRASKAHYLRGLGDLIAYLNLHLCGTLHETRCIWNLICCDRKVIYSK